MGARKNNRHGCEESVRAIRYLEAVLGRAREPQSADSSVIVSDDSGCLTLGRTVSKTHLSSSETKLVEQLCYRSLVGAGPSSMPLDLLQPQEPLCPAGVLRLFTESYVAWYRDDLLSSNWKDSWGSGI